ncbi:alpha/beta hydrolase [Burkholderia sp. Bp9017]|nr:MULTISPECIES: alpha/beta hydrolase [Burkholderia]RQZ16266.1 alpha/beta hydrolase [Burkholderia sp. Bp9017]
MTVPSITVCVDPLEPGIRRFVDTVTAAYARQPDLDTLPLVTRRAIAEQVRAPWAAGGPAMAHVDEIDVPMPHAGTSVHMRVLRPPLDGDLPAFVYLHGGGWMMFSLDTHDRLMREYAARAGVVVIGVDYALAPEHRFPVAIDQVVQVIQWLAQPGALPGVDVRRLAIGGDSAGANLAMASALRLRDIGKGNLLRALVINYGAFDPSPAYQSYEAFGDGRYLLSSHEMRQFWSNYLRDNQDTRDPLAAPILADLANLPPSFFTITDLDVLRDENLRMAERLRDAQTDVTEVVYPGTVHSFLEAVSISAVSNTALDDTSSWLRTQLASPIQ